MVGCLCDSAPGGRSRRGGHPLWTLVQPPRGDRRVPSPRPDGAGRRSVEGHPPPTTGL